MPSWQKYSFAMNQRFITMTLALLATTSETAMIGLPTPSKTWGSLTSDQRPPWNNGDHAILSTYGGWWIKDIIWWYSWQRLVGYGQGNGAAGPGFIAISLLIVNTYLHDGFGARIYSSYYKWLLLFAAVMYIDNTDLIHWAGWPSCSPSKLIATAQSTTYARGSLATATGAAMKPEKCCAYFLSYWYNHGRAKLRMVRALPASIAPITLSSGKIAPSHLRVPLPDGTQLQSLNARYILWSYIWQRYTHSQDGKKRLHIGRPDQITITPTRPCMEECYPPTTTRNDVEHCYRPHVTPQAHETVSMGLFLMSPPT